MKKQKKVIMITGAAKRIGKEIILRLPIEEYNFVVHFNRSKKEAKTLVRQIKDKGGDAKSIQFNLSNTKSIEKFCKSCEALYGRVDILINNAGHSSRVRSVKYVDPDEFQSVFRVNVEGLYRITQAAVRDMLLRQEGTVITVSSMAAITPGLLGGLPYGAAKAASFNMMRSINAELRAEGIRACTILPGEVDTPILDNRPLPPDAEARETMMQAEDVAAAILLCASMPQRTLIEEMTMLPTQPRIVSCDMKAAREIKSSEDQYSLKDL